MLSKNKFVWLKKKKKNSKVLLYYFFTLKNVKTHFFFLKKKKGLKIKIFFQKLFINIKALFFNTSTNRSQVTLPNLVFFGGFSKLTDQSVLLHSLQLGSPANLTAKSLEFMLRLFRRKMIFVVK
jgi:hypothetical protein